MTKKRLAQFEEDRQKMLSSIGMGAEEEPQIALESEEVEVDPYFQNRAADLKERCDSPADFEAGMSQAFLDEIDFDIGLEGKSEEEAKKARKQRRNHQKRTKQRAEQRGSADGFGFMIQALDEFQSTCGGGFLYRAFLLLVAGPVGLRWMQTDNWVCGVIAFLFVGVMGRLVSMWLSYLAAAFMTVAIKIGPRFVCDVREGKPGTKVAVGTANSVLAFTTNLHWLVLIGMVVGCIITYDWTAAKWFDNYLASVILTTFATGMVWAVFDLFGYAFYVGFVNSVLKGANCKYRLRYLHDPSRMLVGTRQGNLVNTKTRVRAFSEAYVGMA
jgi:hypothetical protein